MRALWREHSLGPGYPAGFEHISFVTLPDLRDMAAELRLQQGSTLVDLACGMGGPGLWIARETGAQLVGIDVSEVALTHARARAEALGLASRGRYAAGTFAGTGLDAASADAAMSIDALQYAPDKRAALAEFARILRPGGRLVFTCFALDAARVAGVPILGADPVDDYAPLLERAGFDVESCAETPRWHERLTATYEAVAAARDAIIAEMGEQATSTLLGEITLTLQLQPYSGRVLAIATRR